ncbi:MAG TPA: patatin-like phospholipase family protein, partial [Tepidiformaceae bacterium]|nr:patatin-like phospholipase family protein [Tepidiformaceae bacterium]
MERSANVPCVLVVRPVDRAKLLQLAIGPDILDAQVSLFGGAVMEAGGEVERAEDTLGGHLEWTAIFPNSASALRAAVLLQESVTGETPASPRLQMTCGVFLENERGARRTLFPRGYAGGRIVISEPAYRALDAATQAAYEWKPPRSWRSPRDWKAPWRWGRPSGWRRPSRWWRERSEPRACFWDERFTLINAPFERAFTMEVSEWIEPLRAERARAARERLKVARERAEIQGLKVEAGPLRDEPPTNLPFPERPDVRNDLVGLALGGGGMRAAVFSLGVAQAMARSHALRDVDYMATVSGGGYLGSSLQALLAEDLPYDDPKRLSLSGESFPFSFPRPGDPTDGTATSTGHAVHGLESPALRYIREHARLLGRGIGLFDGYTWATVGQVLVSTLVLWICFLLPALALAGLGAMVFREWFSDQGTTLQRTLMGSAAGFALAAWFLTIFAPPWGRRWWLLAGRVVVVLSLLVAALVVMAIVSTPSDKTAFDEAARFIAALSPFILFGAASVFVLGFEAARGLTASARWKNRLRAISQLTASYFARLAGAVTAMLGVVALIALMDNTITHSSYADTARAVLAAVQVGGLAVAIAAIRRLTTSFEATARNRFQALLPKLVFMVAGYAVLGVTVALASWGLWWLWVHDETAWLWVIALASAVLLVAFGLWDRLGFPALNWLAPHRLYAGLIQASWIIAARAPQERTPRYPVRQWSRVWNRPDLTIRSLRLSNPKTRAAPYPLICTTLNIPGTRDSRMPDRNCESFVIGPVTSGSALTRWMPTERCRDIYQMPLASAAALSGAAVSPSMGFRTNRTLSVALTLFNIRLGQWLRNPRPPDYDGSKRMLNQLPLVLYWKEMLGLATRDDQHIYLSDGEHFEGLGVYELLRRRCRYIVAVAADTGKGTNRPVTFGKLASTLRLARVDFGVEVEFDSLQPLMRDPKDPEYVLSYFAAGNIRYPSEHGHNDEGILVVVSCGMVERGLPADILNYKNVTDPGFPYYPTSDLQYDQPQFESLR